MKARTGKLLAVMSFLAAAAVDASPPGTVGPPPPGGQTRCGSGGWPTRARRRGRKARAGRGRRKVFTQRQHADSHRAAGRVPLRQFESRPHGKFRDSQQSDDRPGRHRFRPFNRRSTSARWRNLRIDFCVERAVEYHSGRDAWQWGNGRRIDERRGQRQRVGGAIARDCLERIGQVKAITKSCQIYSGGRSAMGF